MSKAMKIPVEELMKYGRINPADQNETFCMTVLALKMSRTANGVSELHGQVSREMWKPLYGDVPASRVPIGSITNGVHIGGWLNEKSVHFWTKHLGNSGPVGTCPSFTGPWTCSS